MDNQALFKRLLHAETEDEVDAALTAAGYLVDDEAIWQPLGAMENNFGAIGNQQSEATAALVEKIINGIDAVLMGQCFADGVDPEGQHAPETMASAVERFFQVPNGRISDLTTNRQKDLADSIHLVAVGTRQSPNYLIIDRGEGQTPAKFPDTFLSLMKSNKLRIPFVQGKFNSGGTGILQFCGKKNYQLIVSRRHPKCPVDSTDTTADHWGFTIVRRMLPSGGRRSSVYVYLAPGGNIPSFQADSIKVLPGPGRQNEAPPPYATPLPYGTCIKLYDYRWQSSKSILTLEGRYELERHLFNPCLPFRITETRDYRGHSFSASVLGGWAAATVEDKDGDAAKLEDGFPAYADLNLDGIGKLPYQIAVYRPGTSRRRVPNGVHFVVNGQAHGSLPADFVTRRLKFSYLTGDQGALLVAVDCTAMDSRVREDFFMASRDRVRRNEVYDEIASRLEEDLRHHPGLQAVNQRRRQDEIEKHINEDANQSAFQQLIDSDPSLANIFAAGDRLATRTGPAPAPPFVGRRFPTFFRLSKEPKEGLVKPCPVNRTCRVEFETDAVNDYFSRVTSPGDIHIDPPNLCEHSRLWNGRFETRFRVPWDAKPGDLVPVTITVTDEQRSLPFTMSFTLKAAPAASDESPSGTQPRSKNSDQSGNKQGVVLALPRIVEVHKGEWQAHTPPFDEYRSLLVKHDGHGGFDCYVNVENAFLLTELSHTKDDEKALVKYRFTMGLVLGAMGFIRHLRYLAQVGSDGEGNGAGDQGSEDLEQVSDACNGLARVIVPLVRSLSRGPVE